jgi:hypothetical protein
MKKTNHAWKEEVLARRRSIPVPSGQLLKFMKPIKALKLPSGFSSLHGELKISSKK